MIDTARDSLVILNDERGPEILRNNRGVDCVEALADVKLQHVDLYKVDVSAYANFVPVKKHGVLSIQVTEMKCGKLVISCSFDHRRADLHSFSKFLVAWADMIISNHCGGPNQTKFEAFSALLWKLLAKSAKEDKKRCSELLWRPLVPY
ncbi:hypothetical protein POM88_011319 [Heracleum sosnowskyi]|uniref:Uncharacterized protein n=1 Tax=Heracleum sosnowskyi TaxID=360622 RepID=A0AAD8IWL2_9APIA|nr:hypothetical protein POM88_011319 [Heracleum sosnowskyi]